MVDPNLLANLLAFPGPDTTINLDNLEREIRQSQRLIALTLGKISQPLYVALENADDEKCRDEAEEMSRKRLN